MHRNRSSRKKCKRKWYSNRIHRAMNKKLNAWRSFKNGRSSLNKAMFNKCAKELKNKIFLNEIEKEKKIIESVSSREFFSHVKNETTNRDLIPPLIMPTEGSFAYSDIQKANLLNNYLS